MPGILSSPALEQHSYGFGFLRLMQQPIFFLPVQQMIQIYRFKLLAGQSLLEGRQLQNSSEDSCHGSVISKGLVVKDQILQGAFFNSLQDEAVRAVYRGDDFDRAALQGDRLFGAVPGADAAAEADGRVDDRALF